jgi:hypothetical protein
MKKAMPKLAESTSPEEKLAGFIDQFEPHNARLIRDCRKRMRKLLPSAIELVYDNYNFFVIGYCSTSRPSDCIVSIAAASNGVGLSFYRGAAVPDPEGLLQGSGSQNRFIRLPTVETLDEPAVKALIRAAVSQAKTPLPEKGKGHMIIQSVSAKQRPRRKTKTDS